MYSEQSFSKKWSLKSNYWTALPERKHYLDFGTIFIIFRRRDSTNAVLF